MKPRYSLVPDGFLIEQFQAARPFASFLPGVAGEHGKPLWAFYTNRGQCLASFGVRNKNSAMLEFRPANQAYAFTPLCGFRTFLKIGGEIYEPFQVAAPKKITQRLHIRRHELEIEETNPARGLRIQVVYFTLPNACLPALVRRVFLKNIGPRALDISGVDGLAQVVPYGLMDVLVKQMSRTMEAFAEIRHTNQSLPFFKLKIEPSDKPEVEWIKSGFFAFTLLKGKSLPVITDPALVFGPETSLQFPLAFQQATRLNPAQGRTEALTACAFSPFQTRLAPDSLITWDSFYGQADAWEEARDFRAQVLRHGKYADAKRQENAALLEGLTAQFPLHAGPAMLDPYNRQTFLDNTLRGGQPMRLGKTLVHMFTRKHGDMERDYNFFEIAPTYYSQGNGNFRDVNQNRRCENYLFPEVGAANIETFFNLLQLDGYNPLVTQYEKFVLSPAAYRTLRAECPETQTPAWERFLTTPFSPGQLFEDLLECYGRAEKAQPWLERILNQSEKIQEAAHGEGFWIDHWIYNLDLLESFTAIHPDEVANLFLKRPIFTYFDNECVVQPRAKKYVKRADGSIRQLHAVVKDAEKAKRLARRAQNAHAVRSRMGEGEVYRATLIEKTLGLLAIKAATLDPFGVGIEMEAEKPGWCDALNGLPSLFGSSTHEAFALKRWVGFLRKTLTPYIKEGDAISLAREVAALVRDVSEILLSASAEAFFPTWHRLASRREAFRAETRFGLTGESQSISGRDIRRLWDAIETTLERGLARAWTAEGLCVSYFTHEVVEYEVLPAEGVADKHETPVTYVEVKRFKASPLSAFLEGAVHVLSALPAGRQADPAFAQALYRAVRKSDLYDQKLGMYRMNVPLEKESFEIGRNKIFPPGWLENESIFLHMHYKFLLEILRAGLAEEFFADAKRAWVAFQKPEVYGRSPLENSSFIASSRFPDAQVHGQGFVSRLTGATAEWLSMVFHMGLGPAPFVWEQNALRFAPKPVLAEWLFTAQAKDGFPAQTFGFKLFGQTWIVYHNPKRRPTYGPRAVYPVRFDLTYPEAQRLTHAGASLPQALAQDLRAGRLAQVLITLD